MTAEHARRRRGLMFILSSPSGAGKTTLSRLLLGSDSQLRLSISATTRPPRPGEIDGVHYFFVTPCRFSAMRDEGAFLEWAAVFGNFYGTPRDAVEAALAQGQDVLFDIDWQGARQLTAHAREDVVSVFILPPSRDVLQARLTQRDADRPDAVAKRMAAASSELSHWDEYDYAVVNDDLHGCLGQLQAILAAERLKRVRNGQLGAFVQTLRAEP